VSELLGAAGGAHSGMTLAEAMLPQLPFALTA
jgi:hypothetical protein